MTPNGPVSRAAALHSPTRENRAAAGNPDTIRDRNRAFEEYESKEGDACLLAHPSFLVSTLPSRDVNGPALQSGNFLPN
jgi:hypothetical protein